MQSASGIIKSSFSTFKKPLTQSSTRSLPMYSANSGAFQPGIITPRRAFGPCSPGSFNTSPPCRFLSSLS